MNNKQTTRTELLEKRKSFSVEERLQKSQKIIDKLRGLPEFQQAHTILFYYPLPYEVNILPLLKEIIQIKTVLLPFITNQKKREMEAGEIKSLHDLEIGPFHIHQPKHKTPFPVDAIDLILTPGVAFDEEKNRIGMGKGFYDIFLKKHKSIASKTIGIAFDFQVIKKIPHDENDMKVDKILTDKKLLNNQ